MPAVGVKFIFFISLRRSYAPSNCSKGVKTNMSWYISILELHGLSKYQKRNGYMHMHASTNQIETYIFHFHMQIYHDSEGFTIWLQALMTDHWIDSMDLKIECSKRKCSHIRTFKYNEKRLQTGVKISNVRNNNISCLPATFLVNTNIVNY